MALRRWNQKSVLITDWQCHLLSCPGQLKTPCSVYLCTFSSKGIFILGTFQTTKWWVGCLRLLVVNMGDLEYVNFCRYLLSLSWSKSQGEIELLLLLMIIISLSWSKTQGGSRIPILHSFYTVQRGGWGGGQTHVKKLQKCNSLMIAHYRLKIF